MKKFKFICAICLATLIFTGCSLDEENKSAISTDSEWSTAAGYEKLINACYFDLVRIVYGQAEDTYVIQSEAGTDLWQDPRGGSNGNWSKATSYIDFGAAVSMFGESYSGFYATVNHCNAAIQYAKKVQGLSESEVKALVAEAHFLRAHCLFNIVEYWGAKYLPTTPTEDGLTVLPISPIGDFYKVIFEDLQTAMADLPYSQAVTGHVTKAAAYHLYAKACLTYATYTDGKCGATPVSAEDSKKYLQEAQTTADYLIAHASEFGVQLYSDIEQVFDENNNKANKEALFVVTHSTITSLNPRGNYFNRVWKHFDAFNANTAGVYLDGIKASYDTTVKGYAVQKIAKGNNYLEPSKKFLDLFADNDGRYKAFFKDVWYINNPNDGDYYKWTASDAARYGLDASRVGNAAYNILTGDTAIYISKKAYTQAERDACRYAIYNIDDNHKDPAAPGMFYPSLKKQDCPSLYAGTNASKPYSAADCIVYRLGETYLLSAEAAWRLGDNSKALSRINEIRNRACVGHDHSLDKSGTVDKDMLLDEYALEMCGEWVRWQTLKRFRAFESRIATFNPQIAKLGTFKEEYYLRPVNSYIIALIENGDEYQNPGY